MATLSPARASRRPQRADGVEPRAARQTVVAVAALLAALWAPAAAAAEFELKDGERVLGVATRSGGGYLTIRTATAGVRLLPIEEVTRVALVDQDGEPRIGALKDWRDGVYTIATEEGDVAARDADAAAFDEQPEAVDPRMVSPANLDREIDDLRILAVPPSNPLLHETARLAGELNDEAFQGQTDDPVAPPPPPATSPAPLAPAEGIASATPRERRVELPAADSETETARAEAAPAREAEAAPTARSAVDATDQPPDLSAIPAPRDSADETATATAAAPPTPAPLASAFGASGPAATPADAEDAAAAASPTPSGAETGREAETADRGAAPAPAPAGSSDAPIVGEGPQVSTQPARPRGAFAQLGPSNRGELRSVLKGIIHGGEQTETGATPSADAARPPATSDAAPETAPEDDAERPAAPAAAEAATTRTARAAPSDRRASVIAPPPVASGETADDAPAAGPRPAAPAFAGPFDRDARRLAEQLSEARGVAACWPLAALSNSPVARAPGRDDPTVFRVAAPDDAPAALVESVLAADIAQTGVETAIAPSARGVLISQVSGPAGRRVTRPSRIEVMRTPNSAAAKDALMSGDADLALRFVVRPPADSAPTEAPLGFAPVVAVTATAGPVATLSRSQLRGLIAGEISDWSMIDPTKLGAPKLYLPSVGSAALRATMDYAGVRRASPAAAVYIADPSDRVAAALAAADGVALIVGAPPADARVIPIDGADDISPASIRAGGYPLVLALMRREATGETAHPLAPVVGRAARGGKPMADLEAIGFAPIEACRAAEEACAPNLAAYAAGATEASWKPLRIRADQRARGEVLIRMALPLGDAAGGEAALSDFMSRLSARPDWSERPMTLRLAQGPGAAVRAEAIGMALRCAGAPIRDAILDPRADLPADAIELIAR